MSVVAMLLEVAGVGFVLLATSLNINPVLTFDFQDRNKFLTNLALAALDLVVIVAKLNVRDLVGVLGAGGRGQLGSAHSVLPAHKFDLTRLSSLLPPSEEWALESMWSTILWTWWE